MVIGCPTRYPLQVEVGDQRTVRPQARFNLGRGGEVPDAEQGCRQPHLFAAQGEPLDTGGREHDGLCVRGACDAPAAEDEKLLRGTPQVEGAVSVPDTRETFRRKWGRSG